MGMVQGRDRFRTGTVHRWGQTDSRSAGEEAQVQAQGMAAPSAAWVQAPAAMAQAQVQASAQGKVKGQATAHLDLTLLAQVPLHPAALAAALLSGRCGARRWRGGGSARRSPP